MKTKLLLFLFVFLAITTKSYSQFTFGVSTGLGLKSADFGYKVNNKIVPYIGFQFLNANFNSEQTGEEFDYNLNSVVSYSDQTEFSGSIFIPNVGVKYFIKQKNNLQAYLSLNFSKPIISGNLKFNGEENEEFSDQIKNISLWGSELGFGVEYFFDENFSLGGEFGLRYMHLKYANSYDTDFYNPNTGNYQNTVVENTIKLSTNPTYSRISLNYYF